MQVDVNKIRMTRDWASGDQTTSWVC